MTREEARQEIRNRWRNIILSYTHGIAKQRVNGETSYICPFCEHGKGGDGLTVNPKSKDGNGLKCFGCGWSGDILDLIQQEEGASYNTALSLAARDLGITIDDYTPKTERRYTTPKTAPKTADNDEVDKQTTKDENGRETAEKEPGTEEKDRPAEVLVDYTEYYRECSCRIEQGMFYLQARGISLDTANLYHVGFDPEWISPTAVKRLREAGNNWTPEPTARIIIPVTKNHYVARATDPNVKEYAKMNEKGGGEIGIFNFDAVYRDNSIVFVVEGVFDALAIIETGSAALALNSTSNADKFINALSAGTTSATLILCLDNDNAGRTATPKIREGLTRLNISFIQADINNGCKDPNEALVKDPEAFRDAILDAKHRAEAKPDNVTEYINTLMGTDIARFKSEVKTGFSFLDQKTGGLYKGLYVVAAISSLGKTTFCHQMADQIAAAGNDVLFFSMEQSRLEMVSKSIARKTAQNDIDTAVTSLEIRKGYLPEQVRNATQDYIDMIGDRLSVIEGNFNCDISFIGDYISSYMRKNPGKSPVVFIDYLQILQPTEDENGRRQTTKEAMDAAITELKRISRALYVTIIVISSVNRTNYLTPIDFESIKESGGIEYTADVIWGLQLQCLNDPAFDKQNNIGEKRKLIKEGKNETPRKVELVCLKNRYGVTGESCYFQYYPAVDWFIEDTAKEIEEKNNREYHRAVNNLKSKAVKRR